MKKVAVTVEVPDDFDLAEDGWVIQTVAQEALWDHFGYQRCMGYDDITPSEKYL